MNIGIDMSLDSPAVVIAENEKFKVLCFQQRKKDVLISQQFDNVFLHAVCYDKTLSRFSKIHFITEEIIKFIQTHAPQPPPIRIEGYAFGASSSSVSTLCEVGGVLRYKIHQKGWTFVEIPASTIKKAFSGSGKAKKPDMYQAFIKHDLPPFESILGVKSHQHPLEDIVDAYALAVSVIPRTASASKKNAKKRRRELPQSTEL